MPTHQMHSQRIVPLTELIRRDLDSICDDLEAELSQMAGTRVLVTGGGGFLGYYLVQSVLHWNRLHPRDGIRLTVYDNYARGIPRWLEELAATDPLDLVRHDMTAPLPERMGHFDWVIHAAGIASPMYYRARPLECIDANIVGLRNLLDYAVAEQRSGQPIRGMLFFSSSEIYGDPEPQAIPTPEDYRGYVSCTGPRACYDESKRFGETLCVTFASQFEIPVRIARPFNNYGPGLKITDGRVIPDFAGNVLAGRDLIMFSDGSPTRTFCYATDAITGYYKVLVNGRGGEPYNIGVEGPEISMLQLAELVVATARDLFGYDGKVVRGQSPESNYLVDNPNRRCPRIDKARRELGYDPKVTIEDGIARSLIWYYHNQTADAA